MELSLDHAARRGESLECPVGDGDAEAEAVRGLRAGERAVCTGVAGEEIAQGVLDRLGERFGDAHRKRCAECVAQSARVLDGCPVGGSSDADPEGATGRLQLRGPGGLRAALRQLGVGQGAEHAQQVGDALDVLDLPVVGQPLELTLQLAEDVGVEQLAQLRLAEQLRQEMGVQRQSRRPSLRERRVALVQELRDVPEQERAGEGGRLLRGHLDEADPACLQVTHQLGEAGYVEDVLEAFADRFEDDRERAELGGHLEQLGGALTLLPQRGPLPRAPPGQQQGTRRALAEPGGEQR